LVRDFASFLDETVEPAANAARPDREIANPAPASPSIPFGFVGDMGELPRAGGADTAAYLGLDAEWTGREALPETAPDAIVRELALHRVADLKSLDRVRREFAFRNHPDRMRPEWRDRAMARMQTANRLIDEAKQRLVGRL
jgi:hypothetical protein